MNLGTIIDFINGRPISVGTGIHADVDEGISLSPVIVSTDPQDRALSLYVTQWPSLSITFTPDAVNVWSILFAIAGDQPAEIHGYAVDFHGQLPKVTPCRAKGCLRLSWIKPPVIDLRWVPSGLDPQISYAELYPSRIELVGGRWSKVIDFGGGE